MKRTDTASQYRVCPVCSSDNRKLFYLDRTHGDTFDIVRCKECNCIYTLVQPFAPLESHEREYILDTSDDSLQKSATATPQKELERRLSFIGAHHQASSESSYRSELLSNFQKCSLTFASGSGEIASLCFGYRVAKSFARNDK